MRNLFLSLGITALLFCVACGSGDAGFGGPPPTGNFSNASLNGKYAYQVTGFDFSTGSAVAFREAGVFTADGNGNITSGTDDLSEGTSVFSDPMTGTYSIDADGTGSLIFSFSGGGTINLALTLVDSTKAYVTAIGFNGSLNATGSGLAEKQDASAFSAAPSGTFAFRLHTLSSTLGPSATVGAFTVSGGSLTAGDQDLLRGGALSSQTLTGLFNAPDSNSGRGTGSFTNNLGSTLAFVYYVVNADTVLLFSNDFGNPGLGRAEKQTGGPFADASLAGSYAFGSRGDTNVVLGSRTVGRFTAGGDGTITAGAFDAVQDGVSSTNVDFTGTYTLAPNGRAAATLAPSSGGTIDEVFWLVSPSRAFFLVDDANKYEDGTIDLQTLSSFSNSSVDGRFAFMTDGFDSSRDFNRIGTLDADGAGNLSLRYQFSEPFVTPTVVLPTGTYSVASNGRMTGAVDNLSDNLVFYLVSGSDAYILQNDTDVEVDGVMGKQP